MFNDRNPPPRIGSTRDQNVTWSDFFPMGKLGPSRHGVLR